MAYEKSKTEGKDKEPRMCSVLGLKVMERFNVITKEGDRYLFLDEDLFIDAVGNVTTKNGAGIPGDALAWIINHPESILRCHRLSGPEKEICKQIGATFLKRGEGGHVFLGSEKSEEPDKWIATVHASLFPSLCPGEVLDLDKKSEEWIVCRGDKPGTFKHIPRTALD